MKLDVTIIGGGMIVHDQLLPSIYQLQRSGVVGQINVVDMTSGRLKWLRDEPDFAASFPGQSFNPFPSFSEPPDRKFDEPHRQFLPKMQPRQLVVVAIPDALHYGVVKYCLEQNQHVLCVKPLVQKFAQAEEIEKLAQDRGLLVGIEYHKRFDRRSLEARRGYRAGRFGQFRVGEARLVEPYCYRHSNFQNWFVREQADPFTYIGCHYVDLLYFITGLRPTMVSVLGAEGKFPNGNLGYMWSSGQVVFENGGILTCINGLGYPDHGAGSNDQGMTLYCEGEKNGACIVHNDQFRGVQHGYLDAFKYVNPDYFRLVPWDGPGLRPVGYGYDSVEAIVRAAVDLESRTTGLAADQALTQRRKLLGEIDERGIIATPANSSINELVVEAARDSIQHGGKQVFIDYDPKPRIRGTA